MFKNYFKTAWRNLVRNPRISLINVGGLAIGIACAIILYLFAKSEFGYDTCYPNADRIYRLYTHIDSWLQNFAYHVSPAWWMFGGAGVITLLIALITIGTLSIKAAIANPVKSLRSE